MTEKNLATEIITTDGKVIGKFYKENRTPVAYQELPEHLKNALLATEDIRFYDHSGIDIRGTLRAAVYLGSKGGASTISQQLAKQLFTDQASRNKFQRGIQKVKEWIIATRLERRYTKNEILTMYFNEYDFLNQAIGIESASNIYFDKPPSQLNVSESAMLVGMFKNSSLYNPLRNPEGVKNRRNVVLSQMQKYVKAWKGDTAGNLIFKGTARNFNPNMCGAAKITVAEVEQLVPAGELDPNQIHIPGIFVQRIFQGEHYQKRIEQRTVRQR